MLRRRHAAAVVSFLIASLMLTAGPTSAASQPSAPRGRLHGIDISHWQGTIDWTQVSTVAIRFVIAKATEGQTFDDPNYATYRAGAGAQAISWGAYHFARPDSSTNDAILEADHYTGYADLVSGDLIPALDLESDGGLSSSTLIDWVFDWLGEVEATLGVKPMIYTSPSFWRDHMADTEAFADAGYTLLWIANWDVPRPDVPANNWGGYGWTFWQYDNCLTVPGISGCVDGDLYNGNTLRRVRIP
jgi:GH25 family lysozyme M1 (1,4-beta-N-acetylmuramidase)